MSKIYMNGKLVEKADAVISVYDHGFLYGDGIFEGIRIYNSVVFKLHEHIVRLYESAKSIDLTIPLSIDEMCKAVKDTVQANAKKDGYILVTVLAILSLAIVLVTRLLADSTIEQSFTVNALKKLKAQQLAMSGIEIAKSIIQKQDDDKSGAKQALEILKYLNQWHLIDIKEDDQAVGKINFYLASGFFFFVLRLCAKLGDANFQHASDPRCLITCKANCFLDFERRRERRSFHKMYYID